MSWQDHLKRGPLAWLVAPDQPGARWFGTDINRRLSDILAHSGCVVEENLPSLARGVYRVVTVKPLAPTRAEPPGGLIEARSG